MGKIAIELDSEVWDEIQESLHRTATTSINMYNEPEYKHWMGIARQISHERFLIERNFKKPLVRPENNYRKYLMVKDIKVNAKIRKPSKMNDDIFELQEPVFKSKS